MSAKIFPVRPEVPLFCGFSVEVNNKRYELPTWQKVIIIVTGFLFVGIVGLTLSYYWRNRLVDRLYAEECKKVQNLFQENNPTIEKMPPSPSPTSTITKPYVTEQKPAAKHFEMPKNIDKITPTVSPLVSSIEPISTLAPQRAAAKHFEMPKNIDEIMSTVSPLVTFLKPISIEKKLYVDQEHSRLFCFNDKDFQDKIELPKFLFDAIPPGIYFVCFASTNRVAERIDETLYKNLVSLIGEEANEMIDLIIGHFATHWGPIYNPRTHKKLWFKPSRICQILSFYKDNIRGWEAIYFGGSNDSGHLMSDTITKFTKTWVDASQETANQKRRAAVSRVITELQSNTACRK